RADLAAEAELDGLIHRAVIDDGDVDLLVGLLRLQLGQRVGGVAGDILDLDPVLLLEGGEDLLAHGLLERAAVAGDVEGLLRLCRRSTQQQGRTGHQRVNGMLHRNPLFSVLPAPAAGSCDPQSIGRGTGMRQIDYHGWSISECYRLGACPRALSTPARSKPSVP